MKRIFYFTGHRFTAFHWDGKTFIGACSFEPDDTGFLKFEQYLQSTVNVRTKLLVDVIEEDFRIETIPHVYGKDKEAVVQRLFDKYYRSSGDFTFIETLSRQKTGRKDDDVLLGAITNPQLIQPWLTILEDCGTPLSGIWTLPLISKGMLKYLNTNSTAVLLVSQQVRSNLRQSFFHDGKFISSRTSVINQDDDEDIEIGQYIEHEIFRTLQYLRGQGNIGRDEVVEVHFLTSQSEVDSVNNAMKTNEQQKIVIHSISSIEKAMGLEGLDSKLSNGLFAWLCLNNKSYKGHYGVAEKFKKYYFSLASTALYAASVMLLILGALITESNLSEAIHHSRSTELLNEQKDKFHKTYDTKFKKFESALNDATKMHAAVELANQIKRGSKVSPLDLFIELSRILERAALDDVMIDKIVWGSEQVLLDGNKNETGVVKTNLTAKRPVQHSAVLHGKIPVSTQDLRESVKRIHNIVEILKEHNRIKSVKIIAMPVEVRPDKQFASEASNQKSSSAASGKQGRFSLEIKMKAVDDA